MISTQPATSKWNETLINRSQVLLTATDLEHLPPLFSTDTVPPDRKVVQVHFFLPDWDFWAVEFDLEEGIFAGWVQTPQGPEWGTLRAEDLLALQRPGHPLERDEHWIPRPLMT